MDFTLPVQTVTLTSTTPQFNLPISIHPDNVVLEGPEELTLRLVHVSGQPLADVHDITISITDTDGTVLDITLVSCCYE